MSTVPNFKHLGHFPFCRTTAGAVLGEYDYVAFPTDERDGDGGPGITAAKRLWWDTESIRLIPSGSAISFGDAINFSKVFGSAPDGTFDYFQKYGSMTAGASYTDGTIIPPAARVANAQPFGDSLRCEVLFSGANYSSSAQDEDGFTSFVVAYVEAEWRLYYSFFFHLYGPDGDSLYIANPAGTPPLSSSWVDAADGTVFFAGNELQWYGYRSPDSTASDIGLTAEVDYFSYE